MNFAVKMFDRLEVTESAEVWLNRKVVCYEKYDLDVPGVPLVGAEWCDCD